MQPAHFFTRVLLVSAALSLAGIAGCADGGDGMPRRDGGRDASSDPMDSGGGTLDAGPPDAGQPDANQPDAWVRPPGVGTCQACEEDWQCEEGSFCARLVSGGSACLPGCVPDLPECPRSFSCILDATGTGVSATICAPIGGPCCVDEDGDGYGDGVGCLGPDCNDSDPDIRPDVTEVCDGIDTNCNATVDENPNDCETGRCTDDGDGTYSAVSGATCAAAACVDGSTTDCGLYTCSEGGEEGTTCANACAPAGTDDDTFCIATAHCDSGTCEPDVPDGGACDEGTDCNAGHCDNGFCCSGGTCCGTTADCPGGGGVARVCTNNMTCQGSRGETTCSATFQCQTIDGIADDTACGTGTRALDCGFFDPIFCTGTADQTPPVCPTTCTLDSQCLDGAHCSFGTCIPDRPPGATCGRAQECQDGLFCVDGVCCNSACNGTCEACNLLGSQGTCTPVAAMADPAGECPGFACTGYYDGFGPGETSCFSRMAVSDSVAACNGAGACIPPATLCPMQPRGSAQITCNGACQTPVAGTCSGTIAGGCQNLDNPADRVSCGQGECLRDVQRCIGGLPQTCVQGTPTAEDCDGRDDDCDGTPDDGSGAALCPAAPFAETYTCASATCTFGCVSGRFDLNGSYGDGCECADDAFGNNSCAGLRALGDMSTTSAPLVINGVIVPATEEDWFSVSFPAGGGRGPGQGTPDIRLTGANASNFTLDFLQDCATPSTCETGGSSGVGSYSFTDDEAVPGPNAFTSHNAAWPTTVVFRVRRVSPTTICSEAAYTVTIDR